MANSKDIIEAFVHVVKAVTRFGELIENGPEGGQSSADKLIKKATEMLLMAGASKVRGDVATVDTTADKLTKLLDTFIDIQSEEKKIDLEALKKHTEVDLVEYFRTL